jgi:hypothetical protein
MNMDRLNQIHIGLKLTMVIVDRRYVMQEASK